MLCCACVWRESGRRNATQPSPSSCASRSADPIAPAATCQPLRTEHRGAGRGGTACVYSQHRIELPVRDSGPHGTGPHGFYSRRPRAKLRCASQVAAAAAITPALATRRGKLRTKLVTCSVLSALCFLYLVATSPPFSKPYMLRSLLHK